MKEIKIGKHDVQIYDSIEDLPVARFHKYQKMLLIDSGIGADLAAFDAHLEKARRFILTGDAKNAEQELNNLRMTVYFMSEELTPRHMAFASLVKSIDGHSCDDLSDTGLKTVIQMLSDAPARKMAAVFSEAKKKIDGELMAYFPARFDDATTKEFYGLILRRTKIVLKELSEGRDPDKCPEVAKLENQIITFSKPQNFIGKDSAEIQFDKQFENCCLLISETVQRDAKTMTVLEYYNAFEYVEAKNKQNRGKFKK